MIGDLASNAKNFICTRNLFFNIYLNTYFNSIFESFFKFLERIPVIDPDNLFLLGYKFVVFIMLILNITYVPLEIFWDEESSLKEDISIIFDIIPTIFCIFEICFRFITSYYNEGNYYLYYRNFI